MNRDDFYKIMERLVALLLTMIMSFIAWQSTKWTDQISTLANNVGLLNTKMEVVVTEISNSTQKFSDLKAQSDMHDKMIYDQEARLRVLEKTK